MNDVDELLERCKVWLSMTRRLTPDISDAATFMVGLIATIEQQRAEVQTYKTASSYWYVKCLMDRGHKVDPHSSSQHDDQVIRDMAAERDSRDSAIKELQNEVASLKYLVRHFHVHSGYRDYGYSQMDQRLRYVFYSVTQEDYETICNAWHDMKQEADPC